MRIVSRCTALLVLALLSQAAFAQAPTVANWPARPILVVVPFAPGGADIVLRTYTSLVTDATKWAFLVDYKTGGNGVLAGNAVVKAVADGHTLLMSSTTLALTDIMERKPPYDGWNDFMPVYQLTRTPQLLVVHASLPVRTLPQYIAYAKANPGKINWGMIGLNGIQRLSAEYLHNLLGVQITYVPYKGTAPIGAALLAGEVQASLQAPRNILSHIKAGKLVPLAISQAQGRMPELPDLKSISELGAPEYDVYAWSGLHAPAGTPAAVIQRLNVEFNKALKRPELVAKFESMGEGLGGGSVEEFRGTLAAQRERWIKVAHQIGVKLASD